MVKPLNKKGFTNEQYDRLKAEAAAPYRGLRKFIYIAFGASGFVGALVFLAQIAAQKEADAPLSNLALQVGVVALMVFLFRWDKESPKLPK
jgi:Low psii accumulation1 / Rep27